MSHAAKCDVCGRLFERQHGCLVLDVAVADKKKNRDGDIIFSNWSDVDLCPVHSRAVLDVIHKALDGVRRP